MIQTLKNIDTEFNKLFPELKGREDIFKVKCFYNTKLVQVMFDMKNEVNGNKRAENKLEKFREGFL